jgi:glycosyltransferase involved in cell wall biosynthesis
MTTILLLTPQLPYPPHQGASLRNWHIIRGLAERHRVSLLSFLESNQPADPDYIAPLLSCCQLVEMVPVPIRTTGQRLKQLMTTNRPDMAHRLSSPFFAQKLQHLLQTNQFDMVQVEGIELAAYIPIIRQASPHSKIIYDAHNAETELQWRAFLTDLRRPPRWPAAFYSWLQTGRLRRFEAWACGAADWVTAVSETDAEKLKAYSVLRIPYSEGAIHHTQYAIRTTVIPNCIDVTDYQLLPGEEAIAHDLVFTGKMDYRPNVDAVLWFAEEIWPLIRRQRPQTTWAIVGQKPHPRLESVGRLAGVTVTGRVERVQPYLAGAQLCLMPFRVGSGTRLKLLEAMAAGKALVSTTAGAEGFPVQPGRELCIADEAATFAAAVLRLLANQSEREQLAWAGQQFARSYDWRQVIPRFDEVYEKLNEGERRA